MNTDRSRRTPVTQRPWVRLLILGLLLGFAFQGSRGLWSTDEGRYTDGALLMIQSGNYLIPAYSPDRINLSKPPMTYWIIAGSVKVFGRNTWAVRVPYALAFVLTILLLYAMGRRLLPDKAWLPGLIYGCAVVPFLAANIVSTDVFLTLFEALAALGFVRLSFGGRQRSARIDVALMWLGLGLAFLTKGPPGLVLLLAAIPFTLWRSGWRGLGRLFLPLGLFVFFVVGLLWYLIVVLREPWALHYFLHRQIYQRLFTAAQQRHAGPFGWAVIYLPTLAIGTLPWWPIVLRRWRQLFSAPQDGSWLRRHPGEFFLLLWWLIPFVVFCLAQSRLPLYMLPLFLPLSLLLAFGLRDAVDLGKIQQRVLLGVWVLVLLALKGGVAYGVHPKFDNRLAAQQIQSKVRSGAYQAVVFVENTAQAYTVEEKTPWGLNLYLDKPVYAVAWAAPKSTQRLCHAAHAHRSSLLLLDSATAASALRAMAEQCPVHSSVHVGSWRQRTLILIKA